MDLVGETPVRLPTTNTESTDPTLVAGAVRVCDAPKAPERPVAVRVSRILTGAAALVIGVKRIPAESSAT